MVVTIVLTRGTKYRHKGIEFNEGEPVSVEFEIAQYLLELGSFMEFNAPEGGDFLENLLNSDAIGTAPNIHYVATPLNSVNHDDLNDKRILFRRAGGIGDHVFAAALAAEIKHQFPDCYLCIAVQAEAIPFVESFDAFDKVYTVDQSSRFKLLHSFDYVIPLAGVLGSEAPSSMDDKDYFVEHWNRTGLHTQIPTPLPPLGVLKLVANLAVQTKATDVLREAKILDAPFVVLLLGTSNPLKRLTVDTMQEIAAKLSSPKARRGGAQRLHVLCLGDSTDRVFDPPNPWVSTRTDVTVPVSAELIRRSACVIGADTGLMQYAAAIGAPTVSCWGPTVPDLNIKHFSGPQKHVWSATKDAMECIPCMRLRTSFCPYFGSGYTKCMRGIDTNAVVDGVYDLIEEHPEHPAQKLSVEDAMKSCRSHSDKFRIAVLLDNARVFTGGGFYTWSLAKMLAELQNVSITLFTDANPTEFVYSVGDAIPPSNRLTIVHHDKLSTEWHTDLDFDLVIGNPPFTGMHAVRYAKERGAKSCLLVYETPNYIREYRDGIDGDEKYWEDYKAALIDSDMIVAISKHVKRALRSWLPASIIDEHKPSHLLYPVINTAVADTVLGNDLGFCEYKTDRVVMIARNVNYKSLRGAMKIVAEDFAGGRSRPVELVIIGDDVKKLKKYVLTDVWSNCTVELIENATEHEKWEVLRKAKVVVHSSEFEGFGIPVAEGLYAGAQVIAHPLPVLASEAFTDMIRTYTDEASLINELNAAFAEWDALDDLEEDEEREECEYVSAKARRVFIANNYTPRVVGPRVAKAFKLLMDTHNLKVLKDTGAANRLAADTSIRLAMVAPWNTRCGIAETTRDMISNLKCTYKVFSYTDVPVLSDDTDDVVRCWNRQFDNYYNLIQQIRAFGPNVVHIQHEHSLFQNHESFFKFVTDLRTLGIRIVCTTHTYLPSRFQDDLTKAVDILITTKDIEGAPANSIPVHLPIVPVLPSKSKEKVRLELGIPDDAFVVGSFGMWQDHKGFAGFLDTYNDVSLRTGDNTVYLVFGHCPKKSEYHRDVRRKHVEQIRKGRIQIHNDYVPIADVVARLAACDVLVFNYSVAHHISASAAIRTGMSSGTPIVCTTSPMFMEFEDGLHVVKTQFGDVSGLTEAIAKLCGDMTLRKNLSDACTAYVADHTPELVAKRHEEIYRTVVFGDEEEEL